MSIIIKTSENGVCSFISEEDIIIHVDKKLSIPTSFSTCVVLTIHELTHLSRKHIKKFKHSAIPIGDMSNYFLHPEEMLAFYNSIIVDSYTRNTSFERTLNYYIINYVQKITNSQNVIIRFRRGMTMLHERYGTLVYNIYMTKDNIKEAIEQVERQFNDYIYSIGKHAIMSVPPEQRDEYVREQVLRIEELKRQTIQRIEEDYGYTANVLKVDSQSKDTLEEK